MYELRTRTWERAFDTYVDCPLPVELMRLIVERCDIDALCRFRRASRGCNALGMPLSVRSNVKHWHIWTCYVKRYATNYDHDTGDYTTQTLFVFESDTETGMQCNTQCSTECVTQCNTVRRHVYCTDPDVCTDVSTDADNYAAVVAYAKRRPEFEIDDPTTQYTSLFVNNVYVPAHIDVSTSKRAQAQLRRFVRNLHCSVYGTPLVFDSSSIASATHDPRLLL
jgi:hypothetical protein